MLLSNLCFIRMSDGMSCLQSFGFSPQENSSSVFVSADKTTNMYLMSKDDYGKLLRENISKKYKTCGKNAKRAIDQKASEIATNLGIAERVEVCAEKKAYITLKDHKENFRVNPTCRLINPAKSAIGAISKSYLDKVNSQLRQLLQVNQWRNTDEVISWFKKIPDKRQQQIHQVRHCGILPLNIRATPYQSNQLCKVSFM